MIPARSIRLPRNAANEREPNARRKHGDAVTASKASATGTQLRRVAIIIGITGSYGRGLVQGIARYNREHANWSAFFHPILGDDPPPWLNDWQGEGILARVGNAGYAAMLKKLKLPVVNLRLPTTKLPFPYVGLDHPRIGEIAAEHLISRGTRHFGFYGSAPGVHAGLDERARCFKEAVERAGRKCDLLTIGGGAGAQNWEKTLARLISWLKGLPKPVGVMASNDERGLLVLDACRRARLHVPDDVAVIGVDNDELLCDLAVPPLSSIDLNSEQIGYEACTILDSMMDGNLKVPDSLQIAPRAVVTRRSTDLVAGEDPEVNRAISFIRENAGRALSVADVLAHVQISRAALQTRMRRFAGRTIHEEIEHARVERLKQLLAASELSIKQVAVQSGFSSVQYMTHVFRTVVGETPAQFRKQRLGRPL